MQPVDDRVAGFDEGHVITADGTRHEADVVVLATGFQSSRMLSPMDIRGRSPGPLRELWQDDNPLAYLGITVPGFPNFFIVGGPNTNIGHGGSAIYPAECAIAYIARLLVRMTEDGIGAVEVREPVCRAYTPGLTPSTKALSGLIPAPAAGTATRTAG